MMKRLIPMAIAAGIALLGTGCSSMKSQEPEAPPTPIAGTLSTTAITASATVQKIDLKNRKVTLKNAEGETRTIKVPPEVQNLPQVKVGDEVVVTYYESLAYEVKKAGAGDAPGVAVAEGAGRAKPGDKPGAYGASVTTVTVKITAIDKNKGTVTLEGPDGDSDTVTVRDKSRLENVAVGDLVDLTYTEALAVSVEPKQK